MPNYMRSEAEASADQKLKNMLGTKVRTADLDNNEEYGAPDMDSTAGIAPVGYADDYRKGDKAVSRIGKTEGPIDGNKSKSRLDRPGYARGGAVKGGKNKGTNVNIVIAPQGGASPPPAGLPVPPAAMAPPPPMPPGVPAGPMLPPGRKKGGRVPYEAGAGNGLGKFEKMRNYGDKYARESGKK